MERPKQRSGIWSYLGGAINPTKPDAPVVKVDGPSDAEKFNRYARLADSNGAVVRDTWSRGVQPDVAATRDFPYQCTACDSSFLTALQLSDHLLNAHGQRLHASLIKPKTAQRISHLLDDNNDDDQGQRQRDQPDDDRPSRGGGGGGTLAFFDDDDD